MVDEIDILHESHSGDFPSHSGEKSAGLRRRGMEDDKVYCVDSYCSWQKGAVEHENKLIRQYLPEKSNFNEFSDSYVRNVAKKPNLRPRKKLGFSTPK